MAQPAKRGPGRPRKQPVDDLDDDLIGAAEGDSPTLDISETYGGVSANWLAQMFGFDKNTIKKRLAAANLEVVGRRNGGPLYRLVDAAPYLVTPKVDLTSYIKSLRPNDLPPMLNDAYWSAMLKRQKWEENAKDLWRTADVLEVLGDSFMTIRNTVNLWVEDLDRAKPLTDEQRRTVTALSDKLLELIHKAMVEKPKNRQTPSYVTEIDEIPETSPDPQPEGDE